ncbi:hypothetical protein Ocin01_15559 [Orchesella cincta]|uniref:Uncharacterized protein n=1 Tax=Orchesella cincta TaxID=48709 RepID=A0A1D2MDV0_ORCCI|nr:hypothetical protein Ocin01_15559 [Orchesella cincta]
MQILCFKKSYIFEFCKQLFLLIHRIMSAPEPPTAPVVPPPNAEAEKKAAVPPVVPENPQLVGNPLAEQAVNCEKPTVPPTPAGEAGDQPGNTNPPGENPEGETVIGIDPCLALTPAPAEGGEPPAENVGGTEAQKPLSAGPSTTVYYPAKKYRRHHFIKHELCIPDKDHKVRPVPKGKPSYLKKKTALEKRQDSSIAFVMPKLEDPEVLALRRTNKMVQKLIKYMKKSWKVRVNHKQDERELEHRTLASVYTRKPEDWMERIRAREDRAQLTGFFSPMDVPYDSLIDLELDTALLTFKNLPPDLKITAARWIRARLLKEELKKKRDAYLPRLPHGKVKRPSYNKGRLIKDPGGTAKVDEFCRVAEGFQKVTRGNTTFSKALKEWSQKKETESYSMNSGFGVVREGMFDYNKREPSASVGGASARGTAQNDDGFGGSKQTDHRPSIIDGRKYQRDMLHFEKIMSCIYDIMKSLLSIKIKQLESKFPLPPAAVAQIRERSPDRVVKRKEVPLLILQRQMKQERGDSIIGFGHKSFDFAGRKSVVTQEASYPESKSANRNNPQPTLTHSNAFMPMAPANVNVRQSIADLGNKIQKKSIDIKAHLRKSDAGTLDLSDVINLSPVRSTTQLVSDIKKAHTYHDMMDIHSRKHVLTAEQKIKRLAENPEHAAIRRARNYMTYTKLFERHNRKLKRPVWHDVDITAADFNNEASTGTSLANKDPARLTEADAAEVVELALLKRKNLSNDFGSKRWPEETDIPTPTFPFAYSNIRIPSEEQSRLNLLKKTPHMDDIPPTPVRRLFKLAGIRTTEKDIFTNIMEMKRNFRLTENKLRVYYENEIGKLDWDTLKRFRCKLNGIKPTPVYQWTIGLMRQNQDCSVENVGKTGATSRGASDDDGEVDEEKSLLQKRPALWYKNLQEEAEMNGATRHNGCQLMLHKLLKYCDVDMKTKPHMLNRLALFVVSLPTTELGTTQWQQAVVFLLEHMFGTPSELIFQWLRYRGIPYLL